LGKNKIKPLNFYYGIPHAHTYFSTGKGSPYEAYQYSKENGLDYLVVTDHNSLLIKDLTINNKITSKWTVSNHMLDKFKKKTEDFLPLLGFEAKTFTYGDLNIINSNTFFTGIINNLTLLILWMLNNPNSIITINHPHKNILLLEYNEVLNKLITSIEVGNGLFPNKYLRHDKYYYKLLDNGWKLGAVNGQDNHKINFGDSENLTVFLASELNNNSFVEAFRNRTTYSTESRTLRLYYTINSALMGSEIQIVDKKIKFSIIAEDIKNKIISIEIVTNKNTIIKKVENINLNSIKYLYEHEFDNEESWYLVRIHQEGNRLAISSPIFICAKKN
jgi:hypothetical protein